MMINDLHRAPEPTPADVPFDKNFPVPLPLEDQEQEEIPDHKPE
jgi:hypothetical protein